MGAFPIAGKTAVLVQNMLKFEICYLILFIFYFYLSVTFISKYYITNLKNYRGGKNEK